MFVESNSTDAMHNEGWSAWMVTGEWNIMYKIKWYDGDQLPQGVLEILNDGNTSTFEEAEIDQAAYDSSDESDYEDDENICLCWNKFY